MFISLSSLVNVREISETMTAMAREMEKVQHFIDLTEVVYCFLFLDGFGGRNYWRRNGFSG
jgi:hypothetical protein